MDAVKYRTHDGDVRGWYKVGGSNQQGNCPGIFLPGSLACTHRSPYLLYANWVTRSWVEMLDLKAKLNLIPG